MLLVSHLEMENKDTNYLSAVLHYADVLREDIVKKLDALADIAVLDLCLEREKEAVQQATLCRDPVSHWASS